jgi:hypothetical protein
MSLMLIGIFGCPEIQPPDPAVRYIAFGDSSTEGPADRDYPVILRELLGEPADSFAVEGEDGETAAEGLDRLRLIFSRDLYPNAHTLLYWEGAAAVIDFIEEVDGLLVFSPLAAGYPYSNELDIRLDRVQANIEAAVAEAHSAGLNVYVASYFKGREVTQPCEPLFLNVILPAQVRNANDYITLLNARIREAATNSGATLVDLAAANDEITLDTANFYDCRHLSAKGNAIVAQVFFDTLSQAE